jgi:hypothetical protein
LRKHPVADRCLPVAIDPSLPCRQCRDCVLTEDARIVVELGGGLRVN